MSKSLKLIVEALLFASEQPLSTKDIQSYVPKVKLNDIKSALKVLEYEYEAMGRSFTLKEIANGYQFRSRSDYGHYILKMLQKSPTRLSRAAMETLAIIAYKQPMIRQEIERLRGVDVGGILRTLLEKNLIKIIGRKDLPGRPLIYGTTKKFLEVFDLKNIDSLPKLKEIKSLGAEDYEVQPTLKAQSREEDVLQEPPGEDSPQEPTPGAVASEPAD
ncbi:SMC-Scp complex subunit ScpB [Thermodesulfobacteriota bacterium]